MPTASFGFSEKVALMTGMPQKHSRLSDASKNGVALTILGFATFQDHAQLSVMDQMKFCSYTLPRTP